MVYQTALFEGFTDRRNAMPRQALCRVVARARHLNDTGELVAAKPICRLPGAQFAPEAVADHTQQPVARGMTVNVIDGLEAIEVEQDQPDLLAAIIFGNLRQLLAERAPIRQPSRIISL